MKKYVLTSLVVVLLGLAASAQPNLDPATTGYSPTTGFAGGEVRWQLPPGMSIQQYQAIQSGAYQQGCYGQQNYYYNQGLNGGYYNNYSQGYSTGQGYQGNYSGQSCSPSFNFSPDIPGWRQPSIFR